MNILTAVRQYALVTQARCSVALVPGSERGAPLLSSPHHPEDGDSSCNPSDGQMASATASPARVRVDRAGLHRGRDKHRPVSTSQGTKTIERSPTEWTQLRRKVNSQMHRQNTLTDSNEEITSGEVNA